MGSFFTVIKAVALAAYAILALLALRSRTEPRVKGLFFVFLSGMLLWQITSLMVSLVQTERGALFWYNLLVAGSSLFNVLFFPFTRAFLGIRGQKRLTVAAYTVAVLMAVAGFLMLPFHTVSLGRGGYYVPVFDRPVAYALGAAAYFFWVYGAVNLVRHRARERSPFHRNRITYVLLGAIIVIVGAASNFTGLRDYPVDIACNFVAALVIAYAVVRHRLLDIRVVLVRSLFYSILTGLLVLLYLLSVVGLQKVLELSLGYTSFGYGVVAILVLALVFMPVRNLLQRGIDRLFFRQRYDFQKSMENFSRSLASVHDPSRILDLVVSAVQGTLRVERLFITLWNPERSCYVVERADGMEGASFPESEMRENHMLVRWLSRGGAPFVLEEIRMRPDLAPVLEESRLICDSTGTSVVIPILSKGRLSGTIHLGSKLSGAIINEEDLRFLTTVANQSATALDNAYVYRELERRLAEQTLLFVLSETFRRRLGYEMVLQSATEVLRDFLNLGHCLLCAVRSGGATIYCAGQAAEESRPAVARVLSQYLAAKASAGAAGESQEILDVAGAVRRTGGAAEDDLLLVERHDFFPLRRQNELLGLLVLPARDERGGRPRDRLDLIRAVSSIVSQGMLLNRGIADLREMKSYNDNIINSMASCVVVVDTGMRITTANRAARHFAGFEDEEPAGVLVGKPLEETEILGQLAGLVGDALHHGRTYQSRETLVKLPDQRAIPVGISTSVLSVEGGARGVVLIFTDLSEIKQLESQLLRSEKLASLGQLAAGVSHELRNPLGSIAGYAELIQERIRTEDEVVKRGLGTIVSESERSRRIIESLLDYARLKDPHFDTVEVSKLIDDTVPLVERELSQHHVKLELDYGDGGACIRADREQMREVLINLVLNAQQATVGEGKSIRLATQRHEDRVLVTVTDQGCGIPAEVLNRVFDPFYTTKAEGTGLGLSIVHRIVEAHRGLIFVESTPGTGSIFTISLPVVESDRAD